MDELRAATSPPIDRSRLSRPALTTAGPGGSFRVRVLAGRVRQLPPWLQVTGIWLASRAVTTAILVFFAAFERRTNWAGPHPSYLQFAQFWDSGWYHQIALHGYPSVPPLSSTGAVLENAWAFYPAYPEVVRALMTVSGINWDVLSVAVSLAFSLAGALMFHRLMRLVVPPGSALFAVVLLCIAPISAVQQVGYAEPMGAFLLTVALYLLMRRRYLWLIPVVALMDLTRPIGPAFALLMVAHVVYRVVREPFSRRDTYRAAAALVGSVAMAGAWPVIAWIATGSPMAYVDTELAWRARLAIGNPSLPFEAWFEQLWQLHAPALSLAIMAAIVGLAVLLMASSSVRRLGVDLRLWLGAYTVYLLAVFLPQSSTFRLLLPMSPLFGAAAVPRSRAWRFGLVVVSLVVQCLWIWFAWFDNGGGWSPP